MEREKPIVFLSHSGERSKAVAEALRWWLKKVLQAVEPWKSDRDIDAGALWFNEVADRLEKATFAVICVTPENVDSVWLNFEAGAIGMARRADGSSRSAAPYAFGFDDDAGLLLPQPLAAFEAKTADEQGSLALITAINKTLPHPLESPDLEENFEMWWPKLDQRLAAIASLDQVPTASEPDLEDMVRETLTLVRSLAADPSIRRRVFVPLEARSKLTDELDVDILARLASTSDCGDDLVTATGLTKAARRRFIARALERLGDDGGADDGGSPTTP